MADNLLEQYLTEMGKNRGIGVPETSFYPALKELLNGAGKTLNPKVHCVIHPANRGAGIPDGGLFSAEQIKNLKTIPSSTNPFLVQSPARGVVEAKPLDEELTSTIRTLQVERYLKKYGLVLMTNFRAFALAGLDQVGKPQVLEEFSLARSESEFWQLAAHPRKTEAEYGDSLFEFLRRVLLHNVPLTAPQDLAEYLASYAHEARLGMERQAGIPALDSLRQALEEALGLRFEGEKGEHFFRSTLVQTLFYGIFSSWVLWSRQPGAAQGKFDWHAAAWNLRIPMLRQLFDQVADRDRLGALGLVEVLDRAAAALNRVDRAEFFKSFDEGHAVQYFYEPFLQAYDPVLRKQMGVWYTPDEIVRYQVERVDAVLRSELGLADGLADPKVVVLDPCCGTGAYLREVLRRIAATLRDKGGDALLAHDLKKAALERVFGFEILPAPFVIAHMQLGLELEKLGAPLSDSGAAPERAGVYLTNALTGWEPPREKPKQIAFPGFEEERDAAGRVKQEKPILVILGNPPYNAYAGVSPKEEKGLIAPYKKGLISEWGIRKFNLDELYARFLRLAERRIAEIGGRGVICYISSFSYISDPSFVVVRKRFLDSFDSIWIDCLNGDSRETGKQTPEGNPDPSVFSTEWNKAGIKLGTAVGLFVKRGAETSYKQEEDAGAKVRFRHFWGKNKRAELFASLSEKDFDAQYQISEPLKDNRWSFRPSDIGSAYLGWPKLTDICAEAPSNGLMEKRGGALMDDDPVALKARMKRYFDKTITFGDLLREGHPLTRDAARYDARKAREK